jgi:Cft2 family RNA processing exonuclease
MTALPEIIHLGGEHCVTGSCHLLRAHGLIIHSPLISAPDTSATSDLLILESTYGDRIHPDKTNRIQKLAEHNHNVF